MPSDGFRVSPHNVNSNARPLLRLSVIALAAALGACAQQTAPNELSGSPLPACSAEGTPFATTNFAVYDPSDSTRPPTYGWHDIYESQVRAVVDEHLRVLLGEGNASAAQQVRCDAATYRDMFPAGGALQALASSLPAFRGRTDRLSEMDIGAVLIEWLRVYECAMKEEGVEWTMYAHVERDFRTYGVKDRTPKEEALQRAAYIENALRSGRALTERVLTLLGGFGRLRPLAAELTCLERMSADIRNNMSLLAETSACLPRALNARGSLRDFDLNR